VTKSLIDPRNSLNWNRLGRWNLNARPNGKGGFEPIDPVTAAAPSPLILVGASTENIPFRWRWAGRFECLIEVNPGSLTEFFNLARVARRAIPLGNLGLYRFPQYENVSLYYYTFFPGARFSQMYLEAWWYDGEIQTDVQAGIEYLVANIGLGSSGGSPGLTPSFDLSDTQDLGDD
jgi:hypothetical protein